MEHFNNKYRSSECLYHYTSIKTLVEKIIPTKSLLLNTLAGANDPADSKHWFLTSLSNSPDSYTNEKADEISRQMKNCIRMTCFTTDSSYSSSDCKFDITNHGLSNPQMWHYYGDKNEGVCLVFDKSKLLEQFESQFIEHSHGNVSYRDPIFGETNGDKTFSINHVAYEKLPLFDYAKQHINFKGLRRLLFEKSTHWEKENEYRLITYSNSKDNVLLNFDNSSLKGFVLGVNCKYEDYQLIRRTYMAYKISSLINTKLNFENGIRFLTSAKNPESY